MEWKFIAVKPETKDLLDRLTNIDGKLRGYKKHEVIQFALKTLEDV